MSTPRTPSKPDFASRYGADVLLGMGITAFVAALAALCLDHETIAAILAPISVLVVIVATGLGRLASLKVEVLKLFGFRAKFR
jgi:uncharacterized membrane protein YgdD (TMEM256/DUF423 family)